MSSYVPNTGDVVWLTLDPVHGREQQGRRTFLVLSPQAYNEKTSLSIGCPITNKVKGYPFEVSVTGTSLVTGVVLSDHVKSLDWRARRADLIGAVDARTLDAVRALIRKLLLIP